METEEETVNTDIRWHFFSERVIIDQCVGG